MMSSGMDVQQHKFYAIALYNFVSADLDQLSFSAGEIFSIIRDDDSGWWDAVALNGAAGWVSESFMQRLPYEEAKAYLKLTFGKEALPDYDYDTRSTISADRLSLASVATSGSFYEPISYGDIGLDPSSLTMSTAYVGSNGSTRMSPSSYSSESTYSSFDSNASSHLSSTTMHDSPIYSRPNFARPTAQHWPTGAQTPTTSTIPSPHTRTRSEPMASPADSRRIVPTLVIPPTALREIRETASHSSINERLYLKEPDVSGGPGPTALSPTKSYGSDSSLGSRNGPPTPNPLTTKAGRVLLGPDPDESNLLPRVAQLPWYLRPSYEPTELSVDNDGKVKFASLRALVELLTDPSRPPDPGFRDTFLMTYGSFTDAEEIVELLVKQYETTGPIEAADLTDQDFEDWKTRKLRPVQTRVLDVFTSWFRDHHMAHLDTEIVKRILEFLELIKTPHDNATTARGLVHGIKSRRPDPDNLPSPASLVSPASRKRLALITRSKRQKLDLFKFDVFDIAQTLLIMEFQQYARISANDLIERASRKPSAAIKTREKERISSGDKDKDKAESNPLVRFCDFNMKLENFVKYSILSSDTLSRRRDMVNFFIRLDERCRALHNYAAVGAITAALSSGCLEKLNLTWAHTEKYQKLESLKSLTKNTGNYQSYRNAYKQADLVPCIPYIDMFLISLSNLYDQKPDDGGNMINFLKRRRMADVCKEALRFQKRQLPSELQEFPEILQFLDEQLEAAGGVDDEWFLYRAQEVQKGEEDHSDIRRGLEAAGF